MKTLANCTPSEFLKQTTKLRKAAARWLKDTDIINIRKRIPIFTMVPKDATPEQKAEIVKANAKLKNEQALKNLDAILEAAFESYPEETLEILALCCFVEPEHVDDHPMSFYLSAFTEIINDTAVMSFFTSLMQLAQTAT